MTQLSIAGRMLDKMPPWAKEKDAQLIIDTSGVFIVHPHYPPLVWDSQEQLWREVA